MGAIPHSSLDIDVFGTPPRNRSPAATDPSPEKATWSLRPGKFPTIHYPESWSPTLAFTIYFLYVCGLHPILRSARRIYSYEVVERVRKA